jgi:hypothetical protein
MDDQKTELVSFTTEEHKHYERSVDFYWTIGIIGLVVCVLAFIMRDGLFGVLVVIGVFMYGYTSSRKPNVIKVTLTNKDLSIGTEVYQISKIESFNVFDLKGEKELVLSIRRSYQPVISVCVPDEVAPALKNNLASMAFEDPELMPHIGRRMMARYKI